MTALTLLAADGAVTTAALNESPGYAKPEGALQSRVAYAAAHVVPVTSAENTPGQPAQVDWDATLDFRRSVYSWGLGVADAMDTAQRNMGLDAAATRELIARSAEVAREEGGSVVVGVNTDHVEDELISVDAVIDAYKEQLHFTEEQGAGPVLMASRHLARAAPVSGRLPPRLPRRAAVGDHPGGPALARHRLRPRACRILRRGGLAGGIRCSPRDHCGEPGTVSGVKMSLLDAASEVSVRERLPEGVRMYTGDDFNYVGLIGGADVPDAAQPDRDPQRPRQHSDALLGAFAALTPVASAAIQALDAGDPARYLEILGPTEELSRQIFAAPTFYYKTGVAFLSWLNGHQSAFQMVGGLHSARSLPHLSRIVELANSAHALEQPELAAVRWNGMLRSAGIDVGS